MSVRVLMIGLLLVFAFSSAQAQLIIAKDPKQCNFGLKDSSGQWVVQPQFSSIEYYLWYYKVHAGGKTGLYTWQGKQVVAPIYDDINSAYYQSIEEVEYHRSPKTEQVAGRYYAHFIVKSGGLFGLVNSTGKIIVEPQFTIISTFMEGVAIAKDASNRYAFLDTTGILGYAPVGCTIATDANAYAGKNRFAFSVTTNTNGVSQRTWGVCDEKGNIILPAKFEIIRTECSRLQVLVADSSGRTGMYNLRGKPILSHQLTLIPTQPADAQLRNDFVVAVYHNLHGVVGANGKQIVPFIYDSVQCYWQNRDRTTFLCYRASKIDAYNEAGQCLIHGEYDSVIVARDPWGNENPSLLFLVQSNKKWGAVSETGDTLMELKYDAVYQQDSYFTLFFSPNAVRALYPQREYKSCIVPEITGNEKKQIRKSNPAIFYPNIGDTIGTPFQEISYDWNNNDYDSSMYYRYLGESSSFVEIEVKHMLTEDSLYFVWELPVDISFIPQCKDGTYNHDVSSCFVVSRKGNSYDFGYAYHTRMINDSTYFAYHPNTKFYSQTGKIVFQGNAGAYYYLNNNETDSTVFVQMRSATGKVGMVALNGEVILDTTWYAYQPMTGDSIWVKTLPDSEHCQASWNLYSAAQHKLLLAAENQFITIPYELEYATTSLAYGLNGAGIFNKKTMKYSIAPKYMYINRLDENSRYFITTDFKNQSQLVDRSGVSIHSSHITRAIKINEPGTRNGNNTFGNDSVLLYSLQTTKGIYLVNNFGIRSYHSVNRDSLVELFIRHRSFSRNGYYTHNSVPELCIDSATHLYHWQKQMLCDSIVFGSMNCDYRGDQYGNQIYQGDVWCDTWPEQTSSPLYDNQYTSASYTIVYNSSRILSLRSTAYTGWLQSNAVRKYTTYLLVDSIPFVQHLPDLFIGNKWREVVIEALMQRLDSQPEIRTNCTDSGRYFAMLDQRFLITSDSLLLYPDWEQERYLDKPEICVAIPITDLEQFLKPELLILLREK